MNNSSSDGIVSQWSNSTEPANSTNPGKVFDDIATAFDSIRLVAGSTTNLIPLIAFLRTPTLINPFTIYLIALLGLNFSHILVTNTVSIAMKISESAQQSVVACYLSRYYQMTVLCWFGILHVLIAYTRVWALYWPVHYREKHSKAISVYLCVASFLYVNILTLPAVIMDELFYRKPMENISYGCLYFNYPAQGLYFAIINILCFGLSFVSVLLSVPMILLKRRAIRVRQQALHQTGRNVIHPKPAVKVPVGELLTATTHTHTASAEPPAQSIEGQRSNPPRAMPPAPKSSANLLVILLVSSLYAHYLPAFIYLVISSSNPQFADETMRATVNILTLMHAVFEPLLFIAALGDLRDGIRAQFGLTPRLRGTSG